MTALLIVLVVLLYLATLAVLSRGPGRGHASPSTPTRRGPTGGYGQSKPEVGSVVIRFGGDAEAFLTAVRLAVIDGRALAFEAAPAEELDRNEADADEVGLRVRKP